MKNIKNILIIVGIGAFFGSFAMERGSLSGTPSKPTPASTPMLASPEKAEAPVRSRPLVKRKLDPAFASSATTEPDLTSSEAEMPNPSVVRMKLVNQSNKPILVLYHAQQGLSSKLLARMGKDGFYSDTLMHLHKGPITASLDDRFYRLTYDAVKNALEVSRIYNENPEDATPIETLGLPRNRRNLVLSITPVIGDTKSAFSITPE